MTAYPTYARLLHEVRDTVPDPAASALIHVLERHQPISHRVHRRHCGPCQQVWPCLETVGVAEHLDVSLADLKPAPSAPPENARKLLITSGKHPGEYILEYKVTGEAWYADALREESRNEINVVAAHPEGGCAWEFTISQYDLSGEAVRVSVFDDAFDAFTMLDDFFAALAAEAPSTLQHVRHILDRIGASDSTERFRGSR